MAAFTTADKSRIPDERIDELFAECDLNGSGLLTYDEFKLLVTKTGLADAATSSNLKFAMDLFQRYDEDGSGSIDKFEFKAIAVEMQTDQRRRSILGLVAAAGTGVLVTK